MKCENAQEAPELKGFLYFYSSPLNSFWMTERARLEVKKLKKYKIVKHPIDCFKAFAFKYAPASQLENYVMHFYYFFGFFALNCCNFLNNSEKEL